MKAFLLVHGGLHGGWCWKRVRRLLAQAGHEVITPTLTGLGERAHLGGRETGLTTHITDIVSCAESEELDDFVLVGHSYGGMVITGAADILGARIADLVYLDALVPQSGESAADVVLGGADLSSLPGGMFSGIPGYDYGLTDPDDIAWVRRRTSPQSVGTMIEPLQIRRDLSGLRRTFIECTAGRTGAGQMQVEAIAARASRIATDPSWTHYAIDAPHDSMISHPELTARLLMKIATRA